MENSCVIAVTRAGLGDWLLFDTFEEADEHPLVQYGDVIMRRQSCIFTQFTRLEIPWLLELLDLGHLPTDRKTLENNAEKMWARMRGRSQRPPSDPAVVCETIRRDRQLTKTERKRKMAEAKTEEKKPKPAATTRKFPGNAKITLLADKEGNPYGPKNNPKREGSASHGRFAMYYNGMTVDEYLSKGGLYADLPHDTGKGFIDVK